MAHATPFFIVSNIMCNPWKDISDGAYAPMFAEKVAITTIDGKRTTLKAAVFTDGMGDPVSDDMLDTEREDMTFVFAKKDWPFISTLKRGAQVERCFCSKDYAVSEAKLDECLGWVIKAREK